jgi:hypothetical protein
LAKQPTPARDRLVYHGPVTPLDIDGRAEPVMLFPGKSYADLPRDHPIVGNLIARALLTAEPATPETETAPDGSGDKGA